MRRGSHAVCVEARTLNTINKGYAEQRQKSEIILLHLKLIYHLVKERGMTLQGARQRLKDNREATLRNFEAVERLKTIREELVAMRDALNAFTYNETEALRQNLEASQEQEEGAPE